MRARVAVLFLLGMALLAAIAALHFFSTFDLVDRAARGALRPGEARAFDDLTVTLGRIELAGQVVTGIAWFVWLHRAVANVRAVGGQTAFTPGWAVGWWFIPFANLVQPYRILRSLLNRLDAPSTGLVAYWWGCYLTAGFLGTVASLQRPANLNDLRIFAATFLGLDLIRAAAAVLAVLLVREIEQRIERTARARLTPAPVSPVPAGQATN
jgi:hypothetical protein